MTNGHLVVLVSRAGVVAAAGRESLLPASLVCAKALWSRGPPAAQEHTLGEPPLAAPPALGSVRLTESR